MTTRNASTSMGRGRGTLPLHPIPKTKPGRLHKSLDTPAPIEVRQNLLDYHLAQDAFNDYLQYACPVDLARKDAEVCKTHPQYFLWPSDRFFIHYRPQ